MLGDHLWMLRSSMWMLTVCLQGMWYKLYEYSHVGDLANHDCAGSCQLWASQDDRGVTQL